MGKLYHGKREMSIFFFAPLRAARSLRKEGAYAGSWKGEGKAPAWTWDRT